MFFLEFSTYLVQKLKSRGIPFLISLYVSMCAYILPWCNVFYRKFMARCLIFWFWWHTDPEELKRAQEEMGGQGGVPSLANFLSGAQRTNWHLNEQIWRRRLPGIQIDIVGTFVFRRKKFLLHVKLPLVTTPFLRLKSHEFEYVWMLYFVPDSMG